STRMWRCRSGSVAFFQAEDGIRDSPRQVDVITALGAVGIHAGEQDLACAKIRDNLRPFNGISLGTLAAAVRVNSEFGVRPHFFPPRINRDDDALAAKTLRTLLYEGGIIHRRCIQRDLVGPPA